MTSLLVAILLVATVSSSYGAQTVVSNSCKGTTTPCEVVLETKTSGPGTGAATVTSDASCDRYSTPARPCAQTGISIDSTVVHGSSSSGAAGPSHISTSIVVVSDGNGNSISESSQVPSSSSNSTTTRRLICSCVPTTVISTAISQYTTPAVPVVKKLTTVSPATVRPLGGQQSERMAKAIETALKENAAFGEQIRKSRLAFAS